MTNSWRIGGVQLELREDGTFSIYQPDSNRVMPKDLALEVANLIVAAIHPELDLPVHADAVQPQSTVGGGVIATSEGPQLSDTELQADRNALETSAQLDVKDLLGQMTAEAHADGTDETVTEFGPARTEKPKPPARRKPGRPRKTT
jgi:hypothetical protein